MSSVVNNLGRSHGASALKIVDTESLTASCDIDGLNTILAKCGNSTVAELVLGKSGNELRIMSVIGK